MVSWVCLQFVIVLFPTSFSVISEYMHAKNEEFALFFWGGGGGYSFESNQLGKPSF